MSTMDLQEFLASEATHDRDDLVDLRALDFVSSYDSHLMCPICHCPFVEPVRLQCDHVFCYKCLQSAITIFRSADTDEFPCPSCRTPTSRVSTSVPRLLINMCDEIQVQCPLQAEGCAEVLPRGHVQSHVDKYCGYRLVPCPDDSCEKTIRKKDLQSEERCLHGYFRCSRCEEDVMEKDYEEHDEELCPSLETSCVDCGTTLPQRELKKHVDTCPDVVSPCSASKYGCPVKIRRADSAIHEQICPLVSMGPYFEAQNTRLNSLELTMRHLQQRNEIFEDGMANIRTTLLESARAGRGSNRRRSLTEDDMNPTRSEDDESAERSSNVFSSNATTYLLSLHESLREEVNQVSHALTDLDARASMTIMNECLRIKEDMAHTNAAVNSVRLQVQWLMNPRLHNGARTGGIRSNTATPGNETARSQLTSTSAPGSSSAAGSSLGPLRPRRPSDSGREGTKL
ncbi:Zinc finger RING-type [Penicillium cinerascens]|uniref:Zinc finger RING-type n=1 Tax=Penicillium cinerascens TaxID=70096 RepID=A0A9W9JHE9_9EURO|nr:Zinc finger RING-type [Penicillium cinerascens]KAJ5194970.1 Zinc finger RING-type [Penicillium cinerascens]